MKVDSTTNQTMIRAYQTNQANQAAGTGFSKINTQTAQQNPVKPSKDSVSMSEKANLFQDIQQRIQSSPDIRADKVKDIQQRLDTNTYKPDLGSVADKLLSTDISSHI
ncbi:MAG: flagellar biosynthesis anti-sigma factor FlgM [Thermodesulfobacteriota bacterium]|nr:flagellar biosynthesis anti-sigma factor FlgM [Thermodesulfobacteriota bacterium]